MAVYTTITKDELIIFLKNYDIGNLISFEGILEGVENSNYKIITSEKNFILTIFEKRVNGKELPFLVELQKYLSNKNIKCPKPISDKDNNYINTIQNKNCIIMSFLKGQKLKNSSPQHCYQVGQELAKMHQQTKDFFLYRKKWCSKLIKKK